jgi:nucleoside phosphorylase
MNGETLRLNPAWHKRASEHFPESRSGAMLSVTTPIKTPQDKYIAYETTQAIGVDVESFIVAQIAQKNKLPCLIVRAVLDTAAQSLPEAAMSGVDADGQTQIWPVIKSLIKRPQDLPALMNLARDSGRAQDTLKAAIKKGAPELWAP